MYSFWEIHLKLKRSPANNFDKFNNLSKIQKEEWLRDTQNKAMIALGIDEKSSVALFQWGFFGWKLATSKKLSWIVVNQWWCVRACEKWTAGQLVTPPVPVLPLRSTFQICVTNNQQQPANNNQPIMMITNLPAYQPTPTTQMQTQTTNQPASQPANQ